MHTFSRGPRIEHRELQRQRAIASPCLSEKYQKLKSLTIDVGYYDPANIIKYRQLSHDVNIGSAKSVFRLECSNDECVLGDHELTKELAKAIARRVKTVVGELCCHGWLNKALMQKTRCSHVLRYKLKLGY